MFLIIFDCDGVLVDSEIIASKVNLKLIKTMGLSLTLEEFSAKYSGMTGVDIFKHVAEELDKPLEKDIFAQFETSLDEALRKELKAVPGARAMLDQIQNPYCICSNSSSKRLRQNLKKTKLYDRFHGFIYSAIETGNNRPKPAPDVFLHAAQEFDATPEHTFVIEDSPYGVAGAVGANMRVIGFTGGLHSYPGHGECLLEAGAETTVRRLGDIPGTIAALKNWQEPIGS